MSLPHPLPHTAPRLDSHVTMLLSHAPLPTDTPQRLTPYGRRNRRRSRGQSRHPLGGGGRRELVGQDSRRGKKEKGRREGVVAASNSKQALLFCSGIFLHSLSSLPGASYKGITFPAYSFPPSLPPSHPPSLPPSHLLLGHRGLEEGRSHALRAVGRGRDLHTVREGGREGGRGGREGGEVFLPTNETK